MRYILHVLIISSLILIFGCNKNDEKSNDEKSSKKIAKVKHQIYKYEISDIDNRTTDITLTDGKIKVSKVTQGIIILNIFSSWSPASRGMMTCLNDIQQEYKKDLFVIGIMSNSDMSSQELRGLMKKKKINYFISNSHENDELSTQIVKLLGLDTNYPIPLTVMFKDGDYNNHYIGATPIEMIKSDIEQLRRK